MPIPFARAFCDTLYLVRRLFRKIPTSSGLLISIIIVGILYGKNCIILFSCKESRVYITWARRKKTRFLIYSTLSTRGFLESKIYCALCSADLLVLIHIEDISSEIVDSPYPWKTLRIEIIWLRSEVICYCRSSSTFRYYRSDWPCEYDTCARRASRCWTSTSRSCARRTRRSRTSRSRN